MSVLTQFEAHLSQIFVSMKIWKMAAQVASSLGRPSAQCRFPFPRSEVVSRAVPIADAFDDRESSSLSSVRIVTLFDLHRHSESTAFDPSSSSGEQDQVSSIPFHAPTFLYTISFYHVFSLNLYMRGFRDGVRRAAPRLALRRCLRFALPETVHYSFPVIIINYFR